MDYKVCILAAGVGSRMGGLSENIHKAILPVNFKAVISYIVEKFPDNIEIVVAVGHKQDTVRNYLTLAYPERKFTFIAVDRYSGPNTGPGYSLLKCKDYLQAPFVFFAADTIVTEEIPEPDHNWFGIAPVKDTEQYCTVRIQNNRILQLDVKIKNNNRFAFIGLAGIRDYEIFFKALGEDDKLIHEELQVTNGFEKLIDTGLIPVGFTWFDTGTLDKYKETDRSFSGGNQKFDFSKSNEFLYFVGDRVIKFFADENIAQRRYARAIGPLSGLVPEMEKQQGQFYSYKKIGGRVLYNLIDPTTMRNFLYWAKDNLWQKLTLTEVEQEQFRLACRDFYVNKTHERLKMFHSKKGEASATKQINNSDVPHVNDLLQHVDWHYLEQGIPSNFHGDLQFDNILVPASISTDPRGAFKLLDWRQDFGGLTNVGDTYYDLAKLYGGILLPYNLIKEGMFSFEETETGVYYSFYTKNNLLEAREEFERFVLDNGYDFKKIKTLTALIFLNMSPLHTPDFDSLVYHMGRDMLYKTLKNNPKAIQPAPPKPVPVEKKAITSNLGIGPMSQESVEAVFRYSHYHRKQLMLIASKNQIDWNGGYVNNWTTEQYMNYVQQMKAVYPQADVIICRDHCGPGFNGNHELTDVYQTIEDDIRNGFDLIHIDFCHFKGTYRERLDESRKVIEYMLSLKPEMLLEVGTDENTGTNYSLSNLDEISKEIDFFKDFCHPDFYVIQTGSLVKEINQAGSFNRGFAENASDLLKSKGLKLKEHNDDYLSKEEIASRDGIVDAMNIAPQLGVLQTQFILNKCLLYGIDFTDFIEEVYRGGKWKKWLDKNTPNNKLLCATIAGHYHFASDTYKDIVRRLEEREDIHDNIINMFMDLIHHYENR